MRIGLVARADTGGLGVLTYEFWRHLQPDATLIVEMTDCRGAQDLARYPGALVTPPKMDGALDDFLAQVDIAYCAETVYDDRFPAIARTLDTPVVLHVMPEFWRPIRWVRTWAPTGWHLDHLPAGTPVIPVPVATDRFTPRLRTEADVFFHSQAEAMLDRNGTEIVMAACRLTQRPCTLIIAGGPPGAFPNGEMVGNVKVWHQGYIPDYARLIPEQADVILMPRRYAGLCMPVQEAAASGVPAVMLDVSPNETWTVPEFRLSAHPRGSAAMKGGRFTIHHGDPAALARMMDGAEEHVLAASQNALDWAARNSWSALAPVYREALAAETAR